MLPSFKHFFFLSIFSRPIVKVYNTNTPIEETKRRIRTHLLETNKYSPSYFKNQKKDYYGRFSGLDCRRITIRKIHRPKLFRPNFQNKLGTEIIAKCYLTPKGNKTKLKVVFKSYSAYLIWILIAIYLFLISILFIITSLYNEFNFKAYIIIILMMISFGSVISLVNSFYLKRDFQLLNDLLTGTK